MLEKNAWKNALLNKKFIKYFQKNKNNVNLTCNNFQLFIYFTMLEKNALNNALLNKKFIKYFSEKKNNVNLTAQS